jgi:hypothetical protein
MASSILDYKLDCQARTTTTPMMFAGVGLPAYS